MKLTLPTNEPALLGAAVSAGLTAAVGFGLHLTAEQIVAVGTAVTLVAGLLIRNSVTPVNKQ